MLILAALLTVYIVLGVLYESYIHPITILSTLPSAGVGALLALIVCRTEFSVIALIGIILLIGIVKKNAIMMIDFALEAEREQGLSPREAIYQACLLRFRPIMMTTLAALLGGLPLALGTGTGSELRRPLGIAIVGGLLISQVLTLYTTPVIYLYMERLASSPRWLAEPQPKARAAHVPERRRRPRRAVNISALFIRRPDRDVAARGGASSSRASRRTCSCRSRRCRASTSRPSRSTRRCPARARRRWPRRWRRRSSAASGASPASRRSPRRARSARRQITLQFDLDRDVDAAARDVQAAINAAGGELPANLPTRPDLPQGEPGRLADPHPVAHVGDAAARAGLRRGQQRSSRRRSRRSRASAR